MCLCVCVCVYVGVCVCVISHAWLDSVIYTFQWQSVVITRTYGVL